MYPHFCVSRETAEDFMRLFVNRLAYGIQASKPLPDGRTPYYLAQDWYTKEPKQLDTGVVRMHLNGDITIRYSIAIQYIRIRSVRIRLLPDTEDLQRPGKGP